MDVATMGICFLWLPQRLSVELAESQLAEGNPLSRPKQSSEGGSDRSDDPTQLKPKGRGRKKAREGLRPKEEEEMIR